MKRLIRRVFRKFGYRISRKRSTEDLSMAVQKKLIDSTAGAVVFDVGAYIGEVAIKYSRTFGESARIFAFEPFKDSFEQLKKNTASYPNIYAVNRALGDKKGEAWLNVNAFTATNSLLATTAQAIENWGSDIMETQTRVRVSMETIDNFVSDHQIEAIDILKLDTQGSEYRVLEGARSCIANGQVRIVCMEMIVVPTYDGQKELDEMLKCMRNYGFILYDLHKSLGRHGRLYYMDGIFIYNGSGKA